MHHIIGGNMRYLAQHSQVILVDWRTVEDNLCSTQSRATCDFSFICKAHRWMRKLELYAAMCTRVFEGEGRCAQFICCAYEEHLQASKWTTPQLCYVCARDGTFASEQRNANAQLGIRQHQTYTQEKRPERVHGLHSTCYCVVQLGISRQCQLFQLALIGFLRP